MEYDSLQLLFYGALKVKRITYMATFKGNAVPANEAGTELKARTTAYPIIPLDNTLLPFGIGPEAGFEALVTMGEGGKFAEHGTIDLGRGNTIRFIELAAGTIAEAPDGRAAGAVGWRVLSGTGIFDGATGYITSNFNVGADGDLVDYQLACILVP